MCKNFFMIGISNPANAKKLALAMAPIMSKTDKDGLGYAALTNKGEMFHEKWLNNDMAFTHELESNMLNTLGSLTDKATNKDNYMTGGQIDWENVSTVLMHTRHSTNKVCIENTHPFVIKDTALVHNGIINNHGKFRKEVSTCDSEAILTQYIDNEVGKTSTNFDSVSGAIDGWYACGVLNKDTENGWSVDVFRHNAPLYACVIPEVGGIIFSTSEVYIKEAVIACKFRMSRCYLINQDIFTRFNPFTGERVVQHKFVAHTYSYKPPQRNYGNYDDDDYYANGYSHLRNGEQENKGGSGESSDSKYMPKFVFGNFTAVEVDELEEFYDTLPTDEQLKVDASDFDERYQQLRRLKQEDDKKQVSK